VSDPSNSPLAGRRIMVVEDEALVSMLIEDLLSDMGCEPLGPLTRVSDAIEFVRDTSHQIDAALLDVNLAGERSNAVAEALAARDIAFVLCTGYDDAGIDDRWQDRPLLRKPFVGHQLEKALKEALAGRAAV
jgi:CheY-like chemotaxis protein